MSGFGEGGVTIRELTVDLFISVDGFASGAKEAALTRDSSSWSTALCAREERALLYLADLLRSGKVQCRLLARRKATGVIDRRSLARRLNEVVETGILV